VFIFIVVWNAYIGKMWAQRPNFMQWVTRAGAEISERIIKRLDFLDGMCSEAAVVERRNLPALPPLLPCFV
jgi:hypothetical protein